jgi:COP9 signalosome complex subunit 1
MTRSSIKVNYHENESFGYFLEQEPYARELLDAFMSSRFSVVLDLLDRNSVSGNFLQQIVQSRHLRCDC